jgi:hypothetical protein
MRSRYISCLCALGVVAWLYYYCHDEPAQQHIKQHDRQRTHSTYITAYRNLPASVQKRICLQAQRAERLFFPDIQQYRFAIMRTFLTGGYHHRT